jgi:hypothetical protein
VGSLKDICDVVNNSAVCNVAQPVSEQDGTIIVPTHDWQQFLNHHFRKLKNISTYHHFRFSSSDPGVVFLKQYDDSAKERVPLLKGNWQPDNDFPKVIQPAGLSLERQSYLYERIREFCPEERRDDVCPKPSSTPK